MIKDIDARTADANPVIMAELDNKIIIQTNNGVFQNFNSKVFVSDGTSSGTIEILDSNSLGFDLTVNRFMAYGKQVIIGATSEEHGNELWSYDPASNKLSLLKDLVPGSASSNPRDFTLHNGKIYFIATNSLFASDLIYRTDGTASGTKLVGSLFGKHEFSNILNLESGPNNLFAVINTPTHGVELFLHDGEEKFELLKDICPGNCGGVANSLHFVNEQKALYFTGQDQQDEAHLWRTDGTLAGTKEVADLSPETGSSNPIIMAQLDGTLLFRAWDNQLGFELFKTDGTPEGTALFKDINPTASSLAGSTIAVVYKDLMYFTAYSPNDGLQLWRTDGTSEGTKPALPGVFDANNGIQSLVVFNDTLYFRAYTSEFGYELWKSDGSPEGTSLIADLYPGNASSSPQNLKVVGNRLYFSASQPDIGRELFYIEQELLHPPKDEHQDSSNALLIRPNPTRSDLRIQFSTEVKNLDCMVYDLMGRVVVQTTLNGVQTTLHLNHLVAGQYIVRVEGHSTQKFIKY